MTKEKLRLFYQTLRHVRPTQLYHQVYYRVRNKVGTQRYTQEPPQELRLNFDKGIRYRDSYHDNSRFEFLNLEKQFESIDWNFEDYGKLWVYNLNYFEYLHQEAIIKEQGLALIEDFVSQHSKRSDGLEPYPISLRGINWIKFLSQHGIENTEFSTCLYRDYHRLMDNLEYHLLANHLLENAFSLLFGAYYFKEERMYSKAKNLLIKEVKEQILEDGGHYELSPMYHQIILHRVLDCYNLVKNNSWKNQELMHVLQEKAHMMLAWLENISFRSGEIPKLNDASDGIAPTTNQLVGYAKELGLKWKSTPLGDSGYRKFVFEEFECMMDVGNIAPAYQPGHAHADNLNFVLHYNGKPIIVDTGVSTYEKNARRLVERSTASHNTVTINGLNSSEVWDGFRVARRAETNLEIDTADEIVASHNGYRDLKATHRRHFKRTQGSLIIKDEVTGHDKVTSQGHLHFHPDVKVEETSTGVILNEELQVEIAGSVNICLQEYQFAEGYNKLREGKKLIYKFDQKTILHVLISEVK